MKFNSRCGMVPGISKAQFDLLQPIGLCVTDPGDLGKDLYLSDPYPTYCQPKL